MSKEEPTKKERVDCRICKRHQVDNEGDHCPWCEKKLDDARGEVARIMRERGEI